MPGYSEFVQKYPSYDQTHDLDELRERDYSRLDRLGQIYLDYTGGGLYAELQLRAHQQILAENCFRQPAFFQPDFPGRHAHDRKHPPDHPAVFQRRPG